MFHYSFLFSFHVFSFLYLFLLPSSIFVKSHLTFFNTRLTCFQCWGSVTFWCRSGPADPYLWLKKIWIRSRIQIRTSDYWILVRIREAQKHANLPDPDLDPQHCLFLSLFNNITGEEDTMASQLRFHGLELGLQPLPTFHLVLPYSHTAGWLFLLCRTIRVAILICK